MRTQKGRGYIARADFEFTRERWFVLKIPDDAGCTQGGKKVGSKRETMAGRHAQKDKERQQRHPVGAQCKECLRHRCSVSLLNKKHHLSLSDAHYDDQVMMMFITIFAGD